MVDHDTSSSLKASSEEDVSSVHKPWFVYFLLAGGVLSVSSGPVVFHSLAGISPILLAFWRLQVTLWVLLPLGLHSIYRMPQGYRIQVPCAILGIMVWPMWRKHPNESFRCIAEDRQLALKSWKPVLGSGLLLGLFYCSWVTCILSTSLTHALLAGSSPPIIIAVWTLIMRQPISVGELVGTAIAMIGCIFIAFSAGGNEREVTLVGDLLGLFAHVVFVIYLAIGRGLRQWLPLFAYVLPMHVITAAVLFCAALTFEGVGFDTSPSGVFGLFGSRVYLLKTLYLGTVPGVVGIVSFTAVLKWLHPLVVALPGTMEPLIGSLLGMVLAVGSPPGLFTCIGGAILIVSTVVVIVSSYRREQAAAAAMKASNAEPPAGSTKTPVVDGSDVEQGGDAEKEPLVAQQVELSTQIGLALLEPER